MTSIQRLRQFWADELGCSEMDLSSRGVKVVSHGTLEGYRGVYLFQSKSICIISAPQTLVSEFEAKIVGRNIEECFSANFVSRVLGERLGRIIGPAWIGGIDPQEFQLAHGPETKLLHTDQDWSALEALLSACSSDEVKDSSIIARREPVAGTFLHGVLVAAAGYETLFEKLAHIGVLCHHEYRRQGFAKRAISRITETALQSGLGVRYQTLCSNLPSVSAAQKIGYTEFARTLAARLAD